MNKGEDAMDDETVKVYEFDADDRLHPYLDTIEVEKGTPLTSNQTQVEPTGQYWNGSGWTDELVTAYHYDDNGFWDTMTMVPKGAELLANETVVVPYDENNAGMYKPKFDTTTQKWVETMTADEIAKLNEAPTAKPTTQDKLNASLMSQLSTLKQQLTAQNKVNASLMLKVANLEKQNKEA